MPGVWFLAAIVGAAPAQAQTPPRTCDVHVYPADAVHSVGEDFDAIHDVDQDIAAYYRAAGRPLNWLTPERQRAIWGDLDIGLVVGGAKPATLHAEPLTRREALKPGPRTASDGCVYEIMLPQIMLERGGLANRSLRLFGVVRLYQGGTLVRGYTGFASAPMIGFRLRSWTDADAATAMVDLAYRNAVSLFLHNALATPKTR